MTRVAVPAGYWGSTADLQTDRGGDSEMNQFFIGLSQKLFPNKFDYSLFAFRALKLPITLKRRVGQTDPFTMTVYDHLTSPTGEPR